VLSYYGRQAGLDVPHAIHEFIRRNGLENAQFGQPGVEHLARFDLAARAALAAIRA
jgi:hypothetical protein